MSLYHILKRLFDFVLSLLSIIVLSPLFVIISILVSISSKSTPFFLHKRIGKNGKVINVYKFRTMVPHAEEMISSFTPEQKEEWKENFKLHDDPRVTMVGKVLRKTSLDELPQLFNIFIGNMSFVGPRPLVEDELKWYGKDRSRILSVTPGLTGWWATHGRSNVPYPKRCSLELYYVEHASLALDIKIIFMTFSTVFKRSGAI